jgi:hypothetical protein
MHGSLDLLMDSFRDLPVKLLRTELAQRSHFFAPTFYALSASVREGDLATKKIKRPRGAPKQRVTFVAITEIDEDTGEEVTRHEAREEEVPEVLAREKRWVEEMIGESDTKGQPGQLCHRDRVTDQTLLRNVLLGLAAREDKERLRQQLADELAERERQRAENLDQAARRQGIAVECQCCFDDIAVENTSESR